MKLTANENGNAGLPTTLAQLKAHRRWDRLFNF